MKRKLILLLVGFIAIAAYSQIGYQVSLLNNATGEPRTNESVNVVVRISDSDGGIICEQTKQEITNDFGVLSMTVGESGTFQNADWSKLPFFIEANVDGRLIGKSQILSVPVAEYAKQTGVLTKELLCSKTWKCEIMDGAVSLRFKFFLDGTYEDKFKYPGYDDFETVRGTFEIDGNHVLLISSNDNYDGDILIYNCKKKCLNTSGGNIYW